MAILSTMHIQCTGRNGRIRIELEKLGHRYIFLYSLGSETTVHKAAGELSAMQSNGFTRVDAGVVSLLVRCIEGHAKRGLMEANA